MKPGDRVEPADADDPRSIPAYRNMQGEVLAVGQSGFEVLVAWDMDRGRGAPTWRRITELMLVQGRAE
jgi:hypothetical protein